MQVHCSYCDETAFVSAAELKPVNSNTGDFDGLNILDDPGFPYSFHEVVKCIRDSLTSWQVDIEEDEDGVETLKLTCPRHLQQQKIEELLSQAILEGPANPGTNTPELVEFLIRVEMHLKTLAQEADRPVSLELGMMASALLDELSQRQVL